MSARDYRAGQAYLLLLITGGLAMLVLNPLIAFGGAYWPWQLSSAVLCGMPLLMMAFFLRGQLLRLRREVGIEQRPARFSLITLASRLLLLAGYILLVWVGLARACEVTGPPWYEAKKAVLFQEARAAYSQGDIPATAAVIARTPRAVDRALHTWLIARYPLGIISTELWLGPLCMGLGLFCWMLSLMPCRQARQQMHTPVYAWKSHPVSTTIPTAWPTQPMP